MATADNVIKKETRNFALKGKDGIEVGVFSGKSPRQAALKAANRGHMDIRLRARGIRRFTCSRVRGSRWISRKEHRPGCPIKSGNPRSRRLA